jgi:hypothetical protein
MFFHIFGIISQILKVNIMNDLEVQEDSYEDHAKFLASINSEEFITQIREDREKEIAVKTAFFNSPLCERMVQDIIDKDYSLDNEGFAYFPERVREQLGWQDISDEDVNLFISVMSEDKLFPVDVPTQTDEDYVEIDIVRRGLSITVLYGQGCAIIIRKAK